MLNHDVESQLPSVTKVQGRLAVNHLAALFLPVPWPQFMYEGTPQWTLVQAFIDGRSHCSIPQQT